GELGGKDEYEVASLLKNGEVTKPVIAYIAGSIAQMFDTPPQFGHAKAMAKKQEETALAKREALQAAGASTPNSFTEFITLLNQIPAMTDDAQIQKNHDLTNRKSASF